MRFRGALGLAAFFFIASVSASAQTPPVADPLVRSRQPEAPARIEITAEPIDHFLASDRDRRQFGALHFRGGLVLKSTHKEFGGLSALRVEADGAHFLSQSDKGYWLRGRIVYRDGVPAGIADAEMAPMLGQEGRSLASQRWYDTESLAVDGGIAYVGIERVNQIVRFDYGKDGLLARGRPVATPPGIAELPHNKGLECLAFAPKGMPLGGTLIAVSERGLDDKGNIRGFLIGGPSPGTFSVARSDDYDISDCAITPDADLLLLERSYSWVRGVAMRMRRVPLSAIQPGATVDGPALVEADMGFQIDNMEGLSVHRADDGQIVLTMISDDNFSPLQRTILLQFTLLDR